MSDPVDLNVGDEAPAIASSITGGGDFDLAEQRGRWVVVYFYPRANTPG
jgi:thioredoxin-dependent peroxiredoxin